MDHLGIRQFSFFGNYIGGPFGLKLMERPPDCVVAALLSQPVGYRLENLNEMYDLSGDVWAKEFHGRRPDISMEILETYLHNPYRARPDFVYSVSREFVKSCPTPMLVLPDNPGASVSDCRRDRLTGAQRRLCRLPVRGTTGTDGPDD